MATGGRQYQENDQVDDYLLNQVSKWIIYNKLGSLARDLGLSHAQFSSIAIPYADPKEQIFQVDILSVDNCGKLFLF